MITSVRFCLSYDLLKCDFYLVQSLFISMKFFSVVTDIVMMLLVPAESIMFHNIIYDLTLSTE